MSQTSSEKYLYFTVGLLKGSVALEALRQDATKHHMIDHPGQLIALRLTEYYEMKNPGVAQPAAHLPAVKSSPEAETTVGNEHVSSAETHALPRSVPVSFPSSAAPSANVQPQATPVEQAHRVPAQIHALSTANSESTHTLSQLSGKMRALRLDNESVISVSSAAEQNADEAADYWSTL